MTRVMFDLEVFHSASEHLGPPSCMISSCTRSFKDGLYCRVICDNQDFMSIQINVEMVDTPHNSECF